MEDVPLGFPSRWSDDGSASRTASGIMVTDGAVAADAVQGVTVGHGMTQREVLESLLADGSVRRASTLRAAGVRPQAIANALAAGVITRTGTGAYHKAGMASVPELVGLATACSRMPQAMVCLMSAAHLCGLVDAPPDVVWLALPLGVHEAKEGDASQRIVRWSHAGAFDAGVVDKDICGVPVRHTGPARTVVDLLRYGRRIGGATVGIAAAKRHLARGGTFDEILELATQVNAPIELMKVLSTLEGALAEGPSCEERGSFADASPTASTTRLSSGSPSTR